MKKIELAVLHQEGNLPLIAKLNEIIDVVNELVEENWSRYCHCKNLFCHKPHWPNLEVKQEPKPECEHESQRMEVNFWNGKQTFRAIANVHCPNCGKKL